MTPSSSSFESSFFDHVDKNAVLYIQRLREAVAIKSISSDLKGHLSDINKMVEWTASHIRRLGGKVIIMPNPCNSESEEYPPILLGEFLSDPSKKTVCVYGHLDVQPAERTDGWDTDPFVLTEIDGKLYGRGSTDDKGPSLSWLWAIEAYQQLGKEMPVNIKLIYEGMEESGSVGMAETILELAQPGKFFSDVDFFCISDSYWTGKRKPCISYGLRGLAAFEVSVQCCEQDLHSGVYGGIVHEAVDDLIYLMASLKEPNGKILIKGIMDDVLPMTPEEESLYENIDFDVKEFKVRFVNRHAKPLNSYDISLMTQINIKFIAHIFYLKSKKEVRVTNYGNTLQKNDKKSLLMARWRYPSLTIHGIQGAFSGEGVKTVVPSKVAGKFSIRTVPNMDLEQVRKLVKQHLENEFAKVRF